MNKKISSLLSSAKDFLVEALENYDKQRLNFAIVNAVTATELVLKERLARIHPCLIFKNIDSIKFKKEQTVSLRHLPQRLNNLSVSIATEEAILIQTFADWRNQIVHHMPTFDKKAAHLQLPQLLDFISMFLRRNLGTPLEEFLPKRLYKTANGLLKEWERVISEAREKAKLDKKTIPNACPRCGASGVLSLIDERRIRCYLCGTKNYYYDYCTQCGRKTVSTFSAFDEGNFCDDCIDAAGDQYIQMLIDIERGK
jgi:HEPN domain-containing protein